MIPLFRVDVSPDDPQGLIFEWQYGGERFMIETHPSSKTAVLITPEASAEAKLP